MLAALAAPVTQKIHRHLLLTFTAAFVSRAERLCAAERSTGVVVVVGEGGEAETKSAYLRLCVSVRAAVCGLDITFGSEACLLVPKVNGVYSRGSVCKY